MSQAAITVHPNPYTASVATEAELKAQGVILHRPHMAWGDFLARISRITDRPLASGLLLRLVLEESLLALDGIKTRHVAQRLAPSALRLFQALDLAPATQEAGGLLAASWWEGAKKERLRAAWSGWREGLARARMFTEGDILRAALAAPEALTRSDLARVGQWRFAGFRRWSPLHLDFMRAFADAVAGRVILELPMWTGREELYGPVLAVEGYLKRHAQESRLELEVIEPPLAGDERRTALAAALFVPCSEDAALPACDDRVSILRPANAEAQEIHMVRRLRAWMEEGLALHDMALLAPDIESARPALRRAIIDHGLPLAYQRSMSVLQAPSFAWLQALADCLDPAARLDSFLRLARLWRQWGLVPGPFDEGALLSAVAVLRTEGVETPGRIDWRARFASDPEKPGDRARRHALEDVERWLEPWRQERTLRQWLELTAQLVERLVLPDFTRRDDARHFSVAWHAQSTVRRILGEWRRLEWFGQSETMSGQAFLGWFGGALDVYLRQQSSPEPENIAVLSPAEAVLRPFTALLALDMTQERFPARAQSYDLLRDSERSRLNARVDFPLLEGPRERYQRERMLFLDLLLHVERPEFWAVLATPDGEAVELSPFLLDLARITPVRNLPAQGDITTLTAWRSAALGRMLQGGADAGGPDLPDALREELTCAAQVCAIETERESFMNIESPAQRAQAAFAYVGAVGPDWESRTRTTPRQQFSSNWFDTYSGCPFRLYVERMLRVSAFRDEGLDPSPLLIGEAVHAVLATLVPDLVSAGKPDFDAIEETARARLNAIFSSRHVPDEADRRLCEQEARQWAIRIRLALEKDHAEWAFCTPRYFECDFGKAEDDWPGPLTLADAEGRPFSLVGRMDRVDVGPGQVAVVDYKASRDASASSSRMNKEFGSTAFQMPIYLLALAQAVENGHPAPDITRLAARYLVVGAGKHISREFDLARPEDRALLGRAAGEAASLKSQEPSLIETMGRLVSGMRAGRFDISPRPGACRYCDFATVCRVRGVPLDPDLQEDEAP